MFDFLAENPVDAQWFNDTMIGFHGAEPPSPPTETPVSVIEAVPA